MNDMRKLKHLLVISPILLVLAIFWVVTAWTTKRADYSPCLRLANALERAKTKEEVTKLVSPAEVAVNERLRLVAVCRPDTARIQLPQYPIQALEIAVNFDQQAHVVSTTTNDIVVWQKSR
jgi:hypothetical protein